MAGRESPAKIMGAMEYSRIELNIADVHLSIAACSKKGSGAPVLLLHGFGSTKEDYADFAYHSQVHSRTILMYDAPGHGESQCTDLAALSISFLRETAQQLVEHFRLPSFHLIGHSMGGLTALMLAECLPDTVLSFTNIEGNLSTEDCFLSGQILTYPSDNADEFFTSFIERVWRTPGLSNPIYARGLHGKVRPGAAAPIFRSMVNLSGHGRLLERFVQLPCPKMFVYGDKNRSLSYLGALKRHAVRLAQIPCSGHFPMYANPPALWACIGEFLELTDRGETHGRS